MTLEFPTVLIIPSGIGCSLGGYAGDAIPSARLLAAASGCLITHPNVMNGGSLYWTDPRVHYVEGYGLDSFARGEIALQPVRQQRIGLLLDAAIVNVGACNGDNFITVISFSVKPFSSNG